MDSSGTKTKKNEKKKILLTDLLSDCQTISFFTYPVLVSCFFFAFKRSSASNASRRLVSSSWCQKRAGAAVARSVGQRAQRLGAVGCLEVNRRSQTPLKNRLRPSGDIHQAAAVISRGRRQVREFVSSPLFSVPMPLRHASLLDPVAAQLDDIANEELVFHHGQRLHVGLLDVDVDASGQLRSAVVRIYAYLPWTTPLLVLEHDLLH